MIEGRIRKFGPVVLTAQWNRVTPIISTRFGAIEGEGRRGAPPRLVVQHLLVMARNNASRGSVGSLLSLGNRKGAPSDNLSFFPFLLLLDFARQKVGDQSWQFLLS